MTRVRKLRWTPDEDAILLKYVERGTGNIAAACRAADVELGRGADACKTRYYYLTTKYPENPLLITIGKKRGTPGRKIVKKGCPIPSTPVKKSFWKQILSFFGCK